jgi:deaminated glutathione amidase
MTRVRVAPTAPWRHRAASLGCDRARDPAACGEQLLVLPAAWAAGPAKKDHWVTLVRARAIENTIWLAAAGQVPDAAEPPTKAPTGIGRSMLVDPMGVVRIDLGPARGLGVADVDVAYTDEVRAVLPSLAGRREDIISGRAAAVPG